VFHFTSQAESPQKQIHTMYLFLHVTQLIIKWCVKCKLFNVAINHFLQVTRDIKMFLNKQANGTGEKNSILSIEQEVALLKEVRQQQQCCH
jgi:hypothetical protein